MVIGDDAESQVNDYFVHFKDFTEINRHLYDLKCNFVKLGKVALKEIGKWEPTIILVDAHLTDINCCDILERCRREHLPVILTSDYRLSEMEKSIEALGASAYVPKADSPDDFESLLNKIADLAEETRIRH